MKPSGVLALENICLSFKNIKSIFTSLEKISSINVLVSLFAFLKSTPVLLVSSISL